MSDDQVYEKFVDWLKQSWFGVPDSAVMLKTVRAQYTPDEAKFLTGIPFRFTSLSKIAEMKGMDPDETAATLDKLARKGLVWRSQKGDEIRYYLNDLFFVIMRATFWPGRSDDTSVAVAIQTNAYYYDGLVEDMIKMNYGGLRAIPIETTVESNREIRSYEDVVKLVDRFEYHSVSDCPCRTRKKLDPAYTSSSKPMEVCLHFDDLGRYIVESGMGREITPEETKAILKKSAKAGLVHGVSNWEQNPDTI